MTATHTITDHGYEAIITQNAVMARWTATLNGHRVAGPCRDGSFVTLDDAQRAVTRAMHDWYGLIPKPA